MSGINTPEHIANVDRVKYIVAHRDMHFANIMAAPSGDGAHYRITAVLDWEFSGIVPSTRWNPHKAFLWNGQRSQRAKEEQSRLWAVFERECKDRGAEGFLADLEPNALQDAMQTVVSHVRAIVEVCPKGVPEDLERARSWRKVAEAAMERAFVEEADAVRS